MLKVRIVPTLLYKDFTLVKGVCFDSWRRVGSVIQAVKIFNLREVDELVFLDITATRQQRSPDFRLIDDFADECFMPLSIGGGVHCVEDIQQLLKAGADKVVINSAAFDDPQLIRDASRIFGAQCVVISIDARKGADGKHEVVVESGIRVTGIEPHVYAQQVEQLGAGEILLTSIDRDGTMQGYDLDLISRVAQSVSIPVIASGGAGTCDHFLEVFKLGKASAAAAASIFHFTQNTPLMVKRHLKKNGISVRL